MKDILYFLWIWIFNESLNKNVCILYVPFLSLFHYPSKLTTYLFAHVQLNFPIGMDFDKILQFSRNNLLKNCIFLVNFESLRWLSPHLIMAFNTTEIFSFIIGVFKNCSVIGLINWINGISHQIWKSIFYISWSKVT